LIGRFFIALFGEIGRIFLFAAQAVPACFMPPVYGRLVVQQMLRIGYFSLPVVGLTAFFTGGALALQIFIGGNRYGAEAFVPQIVVLGITRELGPVMAGLMVAGRVSAAIAAEIGTMRVTEQIDALESMGANPIYYLVVPRFLGCLVLIPTLTIMADFMGVLGGYLYSHLLLGIDYHHYWTNSREYVDGFDLAMGIFKSFFFGAAIAIVSCHRGFHCDAGAEGVGRAATNAFVQSFVMILLLDLFLGIFLDEIHSFLRPEGPRKLI